MSDQRGSEVISSALETYAVPIDSLIPDPDNERVHPERNVMAIADSLERFGQTKPIVVRSDGKTIIAGHGTLDAARSLGWRRIAAVPWDGDDREAAAYRIADNRTGDLAEWDDEALALTLAAMDEGEIPIPPGFSDDEVAALLDAADPPVEESLEDEGDDRYLDAPSRAETGDLWRLGEHLLLVGDATDEEAVERFFSASEGGGPGLMVTDPPYGVDYDPGWRNDIDEFDSRRSGRVAGDDRVDWSAALALFPGDVVYVWHAGVNAGPVAAGIEALDFDVRAQIVWTKQHFVLSRGAYHWQHEPLYYAVRRGAKASWAGDRKQSTVWDIRNHNPMGGEGDDVNSNHGTQKPLECMRRPIRNHAHGCVYDPFVGSGTTLIAAEELGRTCLAVEIDPRWADVVIERWALATGGDPEKVEGGAE